MFIHPSSSRCRLLFISLLLAAFFAFRSTAAVARPAAGDGGAPSGVEVHAGTPYLLLADAPVTAPLLIVNRSSKPASGSLTLAGDRCRVEPASVAFRLAPKSWRIVTVRAALRPGAPEGRILCRIGRRTAAIPLRSGIDLAGRVWKRTFTSRAAERLAFAPPQAAVETDDSGWAAIRPPALWNENDLAWCRVRVRIPAGWKGRAVRLHLGAVDDADVTFWNGEEIGRTNGWNLPRNYFVPDRLLRYGAENVLTVMVDNPTHGGGLSRAPLALIAGGAPAVLVSSPVHEGGRTTGKGRPSPGRIGRPCPLRPLRVSRGVLRYPDGAEVALWGTGYYPQSWYQFDSMRRLGVDMRQAIRRDLDDMEAMGVDAIRIHVFDREISDGKGRLLENEHLRLLDFLVAEMSRRGIYFFMTPVAWWGGPNENPEAFSTVTSKPGMMFVPAARRAAARYLRNLLGRVNPLTGRAYRNEPCLALFELMNEPAYFGYGDLLSESYFPQGESAAMLARDRATLRRLWSDWRARHGLADSPANFALFRYEKMRIYLNEMIGAIHGVGARQPIAVSSVGIVEDDLIAAVADSGCDAVTAGAYPGGLTRVNDGINLISEARLPPFDRRWDAKARLVYEFDATGANRSAYLYPILAGAFRSAGVQVACQFQYDSAATARWNLDWNAHWLNLRYTPWKAASFMAAGETFRSMPRGAAFRPGPEEWRRGPTLASFARNLSLFSAPDRLVHSGEFGGVGGAPAIRTSGSFPRVAGVGSSPLVRYGGTGIYFLDRVSPDRLRLRILPDARLVGNLMAGSLASPVAELGWDTHRFELKRAGWREARCIERRNGARREVPRSDGGWLLYPGVYELIRGETNRDEKLHRAVNRTRREPVARRRSNEQQAVATRTGTARAGGGAATPAKARGTMTKVNDDAMRSSDANGSDVLVGIHYFSGWWREEPNKWIVDGRDWRADFPERVPLLGEYNEPATVDREIVAAADRGVDFWQFLWYAPGPDGPREPHADRLGDGLRAYLASPHRSRLRFTVEYVNHPPYAIETDDEWTRACREWIGYMKRPSYLRIGGRPVFKIHGLDYFHRQNGDDPERVARRIGTLRRMAKEAGLPDPLVGGGVMPGGVPGEVRVRGYDFLTTYMDMPPLPRRTEPYPYADLIDWAAAGWSRYARESAKPYVPYLPAGWDPRPWNDPRPSFRLPNEAEWRAALRRVRTALDDSPKMGFPDGKGGRQKAFLIYAWNEFGEGGFVAPTKGDGFMKLEGIRSVFGSKPAP